MATAAVDICNLALIRVGQSQIIDSLAEASVEAEVCNVAYGPARDSVLASFAWPFATRRATLAPLTSTRDGWSLMYALPTDCVAPLFIWSGMLNPPLSGRIPFDVEDDATSGKVLLTDQVDASLIYITNATAVIRYPPLFVEAVAFKLAVDLALGLVKNPALANAMAQQYQLALHQAAATELRQSEEGPPPDSDIITGR